MEFICTYIQKPEQSLEAESGKFPEIFSSHDEILLKAYITQKEKKIEEKVERDRFLFSEASKMENSLQTVNKIEASLSFKVKEKKSTTI